MRRWAPLLVPLAMARAAEASEQGMFEQMSAQMFSHLDADDDGFLAFADVKPLLQSPPARAKGIVREWWHACLPRLRAGMPLDM